MKDATVGTGSGWKRSLDSCLHPMKAKSSSDLGSRLRVKRCRRLQKHRAKHPFKRNSETLTESTSGADLLKRERVARDSARKCETGYKNIVKKRRVERGTGVYLVFHDCYC